MPLPVAAAAIIKAAMLTLAKSSWFRKFLIVKGVGAVAGLSKMVYNKINKLDDATRENLVDIFEETTIPNIKNIILQDYDSELISVVTDRKSRTNPLFYRDEFMEALDEYVYVEIGDNSETLNVPTIDTFNWNQGRLRIIENILEGSVGKYVEVDEEQYIAMYSKRPFTQPFDKTVPKKERIYLLKLNADVNRRWASAYPKDGMVNYPFSNMSSVDIFTNANNYVQENMKDWISAAIKKSQKEQTK